MFVEYSPFLLITFFVGIILLHIAFFVSKYQLHDYSL